MTRDHQTLMDSAYEKFRAPDCAWRRRFLLESLTNLEKLAVLLGNLNNQVCNGGFLQYADNGYAFETGPGGTGAHEAIAAAADMHRDLDPELADHIVAMMRHVEDAPGEHETEEEVVGHETDEETGEEEEVTETVRCRERHFAGTDRFDDAYYAFPQERVMAFFQGVLDAWDEEADPFEGTFAFRAPARRAPRPSHGGVRYPEVSVRLVGEDGNAFAIMARVSAAMRRAGVAQAEIDAFRAEAQAGDYDGLLATCLRWVDCDGPSPAPGPGR